MMHHDSRACFYIFWIVQGKQKSFKIDCNITTMASETLQETKFKISKNIVLNLFPEVLQTPHKLIHGMFGSTCKSYFNQTPICFCVKIKFHHDEIVYLTIFHQKGWKWTDEGRGGQSKFGYIAVEAQQGIEIALDLKPPAARSTSMTYEVIYVPMLSLPWSFFIHVHVLTILNLLQWRCLVVETVLNVNNIAWYDLMQTSICLCWRIGVNQKTCSFWCWNNQCFSFLKGVFAIDCKRKDLVFNH